MHVEGILNVASLNIGVLVTLMPSPWETVQVGTPHIYFPANLTNPYNVGIGTMTPSEKLEVVGTVSANNIISNQPIQTNTLSTTILKLADPAYNAATYQQQYGEVFVENSNLYYIDPKNRIKKELSNKIRKALPSEPQTIGYLPYWINNFTLGQTDILYDKNLATLTVSGNLVVQNQIKQNNFEVLTASMGVTQAMVIKPKISTDGGKNEVQNFTGHQIDIDVNQNWGKKDTIVKGLDINLENKTTYSF